MLQHLDDILILHNPFLLLNLDILFYMCHISASVYLLKTVFLQCVIKHTYVVA